LTEIANRFTVFSSAKGRNQSAERAVPTLNIKRKNEHSFCLIRADSRHKREDVRMDAKQVPARPSLEQYRKQAKDLFKARKSPEGARRLKKFHPRLTKLTDDEITNAELSLADAQRVIAREHAFESWPKFVKHIEELVRADSPVSKFESAADAIVTGDVTALKGLLRENPELVRARSTREHGAPLIHYVAANGVEDFRQKTPKNIVEITSVLLDAGAEVDAISQAYGKAATALGLAATSYHPAKAGVQLELLDELLKSGACVDGATGGWNPLVAALHNGRGDAAVFLADCGARLDLEGAAGTGRVDVVGRYVNDDGTLKEGATREQLDFGFIWACEYGRANVVRYLLERRFKPDWKFRYGETGLHWASYGGHAEIAELLLKTDAPVNAKDQTHEGTPLSWAVYGWGNPAPEFKNARYYEVVEHLIRAGATVDWEWIENSSSASKLRADSRMLATLGRRA
jgi:ankyrin repeat protein